jgi:hypothetical protein
MWRTCRDLAVERLSRKVGRRRTLTPVGRTELSGA